MIQRCAPLSSALLSLSFDATRGSVSAFGYKTKTSSDVRLPVQNRRSGLLENMHHTLGESVAARNRTPFSYSLFGSNHLTLSFWSFSTVRSEMRLPTQSGHLANEISKGCAHHEFPALRFLPVSALRFSTSKRHVSSLLISASSSCGSGIAMPPSSALSWAKFEHRDMPALTAA